MEYQIRQEGEETWIFIRVRLLPKEHGEEKRNLDTEFGQWTAGLPGKEDAESKLEKDKLRNGLPIETWEKRAETAESEEDVSNEPRRKLGAERLRREILNFCVKPRSRKEIAAQFGFSTPDYVIQKYVLPMVRSRMIQMTIPDRPRSKNQKYFSIQIPQEET